MTETGLSEVEASERLKRFGFNELPASGHQSVLRILMRVFQEPMLVLLVSCGFIYIFTGEARDGFLLFASAVFVVSITLYQEVKSERALEALRDLSSPRALVVREGIARRIPGREVVPGDLVRVAEGDRVPADAVLISATHVAVDESLLTGESFSVTKAPDEGFGARPSAVADPGHRLYSGTLVIGGQGLALVTATGVQTELGKIGRSLQEVVEAPTQLQREVSRMIRVFGVLGIGFSIAIALLYGVTRGDWPKGILTGLAAAMSLLPEEFPVIMTVFLAMGAWRISRRNVLTRRVAAIEALGSVSALCVDKTGTLTQNRMSVRELSCQGEVLEVSAAGGMAPRVLEVLELAALACHESPFDPMERAIVAAYEGLVPSPRRAGRARKAQYPLAPGLMAMSCVWQVQGQSDWVVAAKGAPEAILGLCRLGRQEREQALSEVHRFAAEGRRVLAVARAGYPASSRLPENQVDFDFRYVGLLTLEDPIRPEVPEAIAECKGAGIRVIMLTGDYPETARSIAQQLRLPDIVVSGSEVSAIDDLKLRQLVRSASVFARVTPEQKLRIVGALKAAGERVAMTGDGVNDAPSLKWADIGVAMGGRGTDVAREAAAIVLLDDSFASLVAAIRLGRRIYDNLRKAVFFVLAIHVPIAGLAMLPVLFNLPLLLMPAHIVFLELVIDPASSLVYESEEEEPDLMTRGPRSGGAALVQIGDLVFTALEGSIILLLVLSLDVVLLRYGRSDGEARAASFLALVLSNLGLILVSRVRSGGLLATLRKKNTAFAAVTLGAMGLLAAILSVESIRSLFGFKALRPTDFAAALATGALALVFLDALRRVRSRKSLD